MGFPDEVLKGGEFAETDPPSFCLNKVSSSSEQMSRTSKLEVYSRNFGMKGRLTDPGFKLLVFALGGVGA